MIVTTASGAFYGGTFPPRELEQFSKELLEQADGQVLSVTTSYEPGVQISITCRNAKFLYEIVRDDFTVDAVTARLVKWEKL